MRAAGTPSCSAAAISLLLRGHHRVGLKEGTLRVGPAGSSRVITITYTHSHSHTGTHTQTCTHTHTHTMH